MQCDLEGRKRTKKNKNKEQGTGCDKNYFNVSNERRISGEWVNLLEVSQERQARQDTYENNGG